MIMISVNIVLMAENQTECSIEIYKFITLVIAGSKSVNN